MFTKNIFATLMIVHTGFIAFGLIVQLYQLTQLGIPTEFILPYTIPLIGVALVIAVAMNLPIAWYINRRLVRALNDGRLPIAA